MRNSQRYRLKAAECLAAAKLCQGDYRGLLVSIAVFWQWLARQAEAREKPLVSWEVGEPDRQTGRARPPNRTSVGLPTDFTGRRLDTAG
jgi:hypothetical protein